jgi:methylglutaconyl-CoA hydratase
MHSMMIHKTTLITEIKGPVAQLWLNRPHFHNAINASMITEFLETMAVLNADPAIRIIVLRGKGPSFCAGADLNWMQQAVTLDPDQNYQECLALANCFRVLHESPKVTLTLVHGAVLGGAGGFVAAADLSYADESAVFGFAEVRLGLVPATIAPYLIHKLPPPKVRELMLTGRRITAAEAEKIGLIHQSLPADTLEDYGRKVIGDLLQGGPEALLRIKAFLNTWTYPVIDDGLRNQTAAIIAETRISAEAGEGIGAFLEKRKTSWSLSYA